MTRTIKAHELGDEHIGARIRTTMLGWTIEGELAGVRGNSSDYYLGLREKVSGGTTPIRRDADVTILEEAPIRHPDEPTGLGAVVEADTGEETPAWFVSAVDFQGDVKWIRSEVGLSTWRTWRGIQEDAVAPIRVLSEGVHPDDDEPETPEVYAGMVITEWPENDEHLRGWVIEDCEGDWWRWDPREQDRSGKHWHWGALGFFTPTGRPWKVIQKVSS